MNSETIHLRDYFRILVKRKNILITFFILALIFSVIITFTATPQFLAVTKVMIEKNTADPLSNRYQYTTYDPEFLETQYQLIKSTSVIQKAIKQLNPEKIFDSFFKKEDQKKSYISSLLKWLKKTTIAFKKTIGLTGLPFESDQTINKIIPDTPETKIRRSDIMESVVKRNIVLMPVANSRIVQIGFFSENPEIASRVANSLAQAYIEELVDMQMETAGYSIAWMKKKADIQRINLEESEKALHDYKKKHDIITVEDRLAILPERLSELSTNLTKTETKRKELFAVYNQVRGRSLSALETIPIIAQNSTLDDINKKLLTTDQKISELSKKYGPKHPKMIAAKNEATGLKAKKNQVLKDLVKTIENEYLLAKENERDTKNLLDQTKFQAASLGERSIQLGILKRKVETNRYLYDALVKKMKEKDITERSQSVNVWIIEDAKTPVYPAKPRKKRNIILGLIIGFLGGIGLCFFLEYLDNTVKTPEDVEEKFNIPVISTIDIFTGKESNIVKNVLYDTSSLIAESFKALRTSVFLSSAEKPPKTILISSMIPGEGKSSIAACLAATIAHTGKKVLLIDADMRRPVQHNQFEQDNNTGLSSFLAGISESKEIIHSEVIENLSLISAGPVPPNPSELLSSNRMKNLLEELSDAYDMIIVDSPPLAAVTDPVILSQSVEGVIIVTWAGKTTYEMLGKGLKQLSEIKAPFTGLVLNRFNAKKSGYYYNYGDYYYSSES